MVLLSKFSLYRAVRAPIGVRALRLQPHQPHGWSGPDRNATQVPLRRPASVRKQIETSSIFRSPEGRQPIRGANSNDVIVIITSWRVRAHGNFDLRCVALPITGNRALLDLWPRRRWRCPVALLGWVSTGAATEGVPPIFSWKSNDDLF